MRLFPWWSKSPEHQKEEADASGYRLDRKMHEATATAHRMAVQTEKENSRAQHVLAVADEALRLIKGMEERR